MSREMISKEGLFISWRTLCSWLLVSPPAALFFSYLMSTEAAPQWFQAIGSIVAILVAVWISKQEERRRQRERVQEEIRRMKNILSITRATNLVLKDIIDRAKLSIDDALLNPVFKKEFFETVKTMVEGKVRSLQKIDISSTASSDFANRFIYFLSSAELAANLVSHIQNELSETKLSAALSEFGGKSDRYISEMDAALQKYCRLHGVDV